MTDLTRYGIVPDKFTWPAGAIANSQLPKTRFLIRNRDGALVIIQPVIVMIENQGFAALRVFPTRRMTLEDIVSYPYPDTTRPCEGGYVSPQA